MPVKSHATPHEPTWFRAQLNLIRFGARAIAYRISLARRPSVLELVGLALALIGSWTVIQSIGSLIGRTPWSYILLTGAAITLLAALLVPRLATDYSAILRLASVDTSSARRLHDDCVLGMQNQTAWDLLGQIYFQLIGEMNATADSPSNRLSYVLDANCRPFLCAVLESPSAAGLSDILNTDLVPSNLAPDVQSFADSRQSFIRQLRNINVFENPMGDEEGDNLILTDLTLNGEALRVSCSVATYGEIVRTSDALQNEFAIFAFLSSHHSRRHRRRAPAMDSPGEQSRANPASARSLTFRVDDVLRLLPWRRQIHQWSGTAQDLFFHPRGRASGLGVSVAMVSKNADHETAFVARRAPNVGIYPGALHVVPSGMCNAKDDLRVADAKLRNDYLKWIMLAELLEECFDVEEMAQTRTFDWIATAKSELGKRGLESFEPTLTGLAFDFLNLRWDVCACVDVGANDDRDDYRLCWEYTPLQQVRALRLDRIGRDLDRRHLVQAGAGSLALAHSGRPLLKRIGNEV